jgi:S-methylmethionine-dependent homocysteine/selenocysteine methylase
MDSALSFHSVLAKNSFVLMEAAVSGILEHTSDAVLHPVLGCAPCIYHASGQQALQAVYSRFVAIAREAGVPLLVTAPTWRTNQQLVEESKVPASINRDAVLFMQGLIQKLGHGRDLPIALGGLLGPMNDAYRPDLSLDEKRAFDFHAWQAQELAQAGVDYLMAATLPAVEEAAGLARAMAQAEVPYIVSFVLDRQGRILDGTPLDEAIQRIDAQVVPPPTGYMINCSYPSFLRPEKEPSRVLSRLIGYQANASSLDYNTLDQTDQIEADPLQDWGEHMFALHRRWGLKILGGCCGTGEEHLRYLVQGL